MLLTSRTDMPLTEINKIIMLFFRTITAAIFRIFCMETFYLEYRIIAK